MRVEIPTCTRCFCLPLRYGIIICGYINLISSLLVIALETTATIDDSSRMQYATIYKGVLLYCQVWFILVLYATEIIFSIILIIGAHLKKMRMLRAFYYYSLSTTLAVLVVFLLVRTDDYYKNIGGHIFEFCMAFCAFVFQVYLWLLIRSELQKVKDRSQMTFVNHVSEIVINGPIAEGRNPL